MNLDFNKTYNNVRFQKWEKFFSFDFYVDKFIADIKNENPEIIIVSDKRERCGDGHYATIIGMFSSNDSNDKFEYDFIDNFFEDEYFKVDQLLGDKTLRYWEDFHYEFNSPLLDEIESSYNHLKTEEDERDLCFENLVDSFDSLRTFNVSSSEVDGLSSKSIDCLIKYNDIIESFKNKFNEIKDELAKKVGITEKR